MIFFNQGVKITTDIFDLKQQVCADVNADDEVNLQDLALLKQYVMNDNVQLGVDIK